MKKIFPFLILFCFFIIPKNTNALTFTDCKNVEHTVSTEEELIDYSYFTSPSDSDITGLVGVYESSGNVYDFYRVYCDNPFAVKRTSSIQFFTQPSNSPLVCSGNLVHITDCDSNFSSCVSSIISKNKVDFITSSNTYSVLFNPIIYTNATKDDIYLNASSYSISSIRNKYSCDVEPEPVIEEVSMFDVVSTFLIQFINILPFIIPFILIINLACNMLFNDRG